MKCLFVATPHECASLYAKYSSRVFRWCGSVLPCLHTDQGAWYFIMAGCTAHVQVLFRRIFAFSLLLRLSLDLVFSDGFTASTHQPINHDLSCSRPTEATLFCFASSRVGTGHVTCCTVPWQGIQRVTRYLSFGRHQVFYSLPYRFCRFVITIIIYSGLSGSHTCDTSFERGPLMARRR